MEIFYTILALVLVGIIAFLVTHFRPLSNDEIGELASKKRRQRIRRYFVFTSDEFSVDPEFKRGMDACGRFYSCEEKLWEFPSLAAALLKYKKHEWFIIGFEKEQMVTGFWVNKGSDGNSVQLPLPFDVVAKTASDGGYRSVLMFHNHPNPNPGEFDCSRPSELDSQGARERAHVLNTGGINLVEFVCERGRHFEYFRSAFDSFFPVAEITPRLAAKNGQSRLGNLGLHCERLIG